ncbi:MAG TPA: cytochrome b [Mycobacterium sp.]|nr:cytochrome b [Mycobacterium sp.]
MTARYPLRTRILHWLTAVLIFSTLLIGFVMVNSIGSYASLRAIHMTLGVLILAIVVLRAANRLTHRAPKLPDTVGWVEHKLVVGSELTLYALMLAQPLIGWAMVSASGRPVVIFGSLQLPRIAPFNADLFFILRQAHSVLAYALVVVIAAHVSAVLLHTLTLRDGMLSRMTFTKPRERAQNARNSRRVGVQTRTSPTGVWAHAEKEARRG